MRGGVTAALLFVLLLAAAAAADAGPRRPAAVSGPSMTVTASPQTANARRVRLTVTLHYEMQCRYPGAGPLVVTFPKAMKLPKRFAAHTVLLSGEPIAATRKGRQVTVTIAPPTGRLCNLMAPGSVTLLFTRKAKLSNPARARTYHFTATHRTNAFKAKLAIRPAG